VLAAVAGMYWLLLGPSLAIQAYIGSRLKVPYSMQTVRSVFGSSPEGRGGRHRSPRRSESRESTVDAEKLATIAEMKECMRETLGEFLRPLQIEVTEVKGAVDMINLKVDSHVQAAGIDSKDLHGKMDGMAKRLSKIEQQAAGPAQPASAGASMPASKFDPDPADVERKNKQLVLKFGCVVEKDSARAVVDEVFGQIGESLDKLQASVEHVYRPKEAPGSTLILQFADNCPNLLKARRELKYAMSTKEGDTWTENTTHGGQPVRMFWPKYQHEVNRDEPLYEAWKMLAAQRGVDKSSMRCDAKHSRTVKDTATGAVLARQVLGSWRVEYCQ